MNQAELEQVCHDVSAAIGGLRFGKVFPLGDLAMAIDFYPHSGVYLYVSIEPKRRRVYLIRRRLKELERASTHPSPFVIALRRQLSGREVAAVDLLPGTKGMTVRFAPLDEAEFTLVIQLGGKVPNALLLDRDGKIAAAARVSNEDGQRVEQKYVSPADTHDEGPVRETVGRSLSDVLDADDRADEDKTDLASLASAARKKISTDIAKRLKLVANLEGDLEKQGDASEWKRFGDLILANISNIRREGDSLIVTDYFDADQREIAIASDRNLAPAEAAELFFKKYTKARNGVIAISERLDAVNKEIEALRSRRSEIENAIERDDADFLRSFLPQKRAAAPAARKKVKPDDLKGVRRFVSSDGMEILVGKKASDNDHLTFRIARSLDLWLHAADYPGSHVVVRNPNRKEIPNRTLTEAAQLAAFYSDARSQQKAAVRYTQKKFVNKPRRSAPGLVSLASYKTILVEPGVKVKKADDDG